MPDAQQAERDHATALGFLVCSWNNFHELLGHLFSAVVSGELSETALAAWHSMNSDRSQREMLRASAEEALAPRPELKDDILWLLKRADAVSDQRNNAVHASYAVLSKSPGAEVIAFDYYGNRRAKKLAGKNLLIEFERCRNDIKALSVYSISLYQRVVDPDNAQVVQRPTF